MEAPTSAEALRLARLDWMVVQEPVYTGYNEMVKGYKANVRSSDRKVLGVVSDRYKVVQNTDAFSFTDREKYRTGSDPSKRNRGSQGWR